MSLQRSLCLMALISVYLVCLYQAVEGFEYSGYCYKMCMWGRGGNLCKCNAVHFAGKRDHYPRVGSEMGEDVPLSAEERTILRQLSEEGEGDDGTYGLINPFDDAELTSSVAHTRGATRSMLGDLKRRLHAYTERSRDKRSPSEEVAKIF